MGIRCNRGVVVIHVGPNTSQRTRALEGPRDDVETRSFGACGVGGRDDRGVVWTACCEEVVHGRGDDVDSVSFERGETCNGGSVAIWGVA